MLTPKRKRRMSHAVGIITVSVTGDCTIPFTDTVTVTLL